MISGESSDAASSANPRMPRRRSGNRTISSAKEPLAPVAAPSARSSEAENHNERRDPARQSGLVSSARKCRSAGLNRRNSQASEDLWEHIGSDLLTSLDCQAAISLPELLDGWSPQPLLAEKMIIIVPYFCSEVLKFVLGGRNSGQRGNDQWMPFGT